MKHAGCYSPGPFRTLGWLVFALAGMVVPWETRAEKLPYRAADPRLEVVRVDHDPRESFLGLAASPQGYVFVGGREALFVYPPRKDAPGQFGPRRLLYRFPKDTWVYDIEIWGEDLLVLTVSALYRLPGAARGTFQGRPERLIWGLPLGHVHQCYHGMEIGPQGDVYFAHGDPLWYYGDFSRPDHWGHWTIFSRPMNLRTPYTGVGGVFRCRVDGTRFLVEATGFRNNCGLAFDRYWNLFTNDNDHESLPVAYVPGRLMYVIPHAYYSWPRGWSPAKQPGRHDLLPNMNDRLGRFVPVGQCYYDDPYLGAKYRHALLVARWGTRQVTYYPLQPHGANFRVEEHPLLVAQGTARPVHVCPLPDGRVLVSIAYMAHNEGSPVYPSDLVLLRRKDEPQPRNWRPYDHLSVDAERLWQELRSESWTRRQWAHRELLRRGGKLLHQAVEQLAQSRPDEPVRMHLIWLAAASGSDQARQLLARVLDHGTPEERVQVLRAYRDYPTLGGQAQVFLKRLDDPHPQVQLAALVGLFETMLRPRQLQGVIDGPAQSSDPTLRHLATMLLARRAAPGQLVALCRAKEPQARLAGVLAAGFRLTVPPPTGPLDEKTPLAPPRGVVVPYDGETVDLRKHVTRLGNFTVAEWWKAVRHTPEQEQLFAALHQRLKDTDPAVRLQAAFFLRLLADPRSEADVAQVIRQDRLRRLRTARLQHVRQVWVVGPFADGGRGLKTPHPVEKGPVNLAAQYPGPQGKKLAWRQVRVGRMVQFDQLYGPCPDSSFYVHFRLESATDQLINLLVGSDDGVRVWVNRRLVWDHPVRRGALPLQDVVPMELAAGSNEVLIRVNNYEGTSGLYLHYRSLEPVVALLPEKVDPRELARRLSSGPVKYPPDFFTRDWAAEARRGDPQRGRKLFETLSCSKCHSVGSAVGGQGGPSLAQAAQRFTVPYLVESILDPNKKVSPVFRATGLLLENGKQLQGLVVKETAEELELLLPDTKRVKVPKSQVERRRQLPLSPMPQGLVRKADELRDLLAFLLQGTASQTGGQ